MEWHQLRRSLSNTYKDLQKWNRDQFGFAHLKIKQLEDELGSIPSGDGAKESCLRADLRVHRARLESILRQKSREIWLKEKDRNFKFFHMSHAVQRCRNRILAVKNVKDWIHSEEGIKDYFTENVTNLFKSNYPTIPNNLNEIGEKVIENTMILASPTTEEVKESINHLHPLKSPGPDGFFGCFYRNYWSTAGERIVRCVQVCFRLRTCWLHIGSFAIRTINILLVCVFSNELATYFWLVL